MKKKLLLCLLFTLLLMALPARADIGPKPSVRVQFTGGDGTPFYATLLSARPSTGPSSAWEAGYPQRDDGPGGTAIWEAFYSYEDEDGYYFLQEWWDCSDGQPLSWTYYPPSPFKILIYFPDTGTFRVSGSYERYAFDSYYTVDLSASGLLTAQPSYDYTWELLSLGARVCLTILLELALALVFGYREKKVLTFLALVNVVTQVVLNVLLNVANYTSGSMAFVLAYVPLELLIFALEAILYAVFLPRRSSRPQNRGRAVGYAFLANTFSFAAGLWLARVIPGIF